MRTAPIMLALALAPTGPLAAAAGPQQAELEPERILVAHADGSWTITRAIGEEPVPLEAATRGLIAEDVELDKRAMRKAEADEAAERAFEEAIEQSRREQRPQ